MIMKQEIFKLMLTGKLDDIIPILEIKKQKELLELQKLLSDYISNWTQFCYEESRSISDERQFIEKYKNHRFFGVLLTSLNKSDIEDIKKLVLNNLMNKYNREEKVKKFFDFLKE